MRTPRNEPEPDAPHPAEVHVIEHAAFADLDFEFRALLEQQTRSPGVPAFLNFFDRGGRSHAQVILLYRPAQRLLKRLVLSGEADDRRNSRLEVWRDVGLEEIHDFVESQFLEKTRPATLEPEVFLGVLDNFIDRGEV
ncbi:MAG: hypothetical protein ACKVU1_11960 [bacterium]